MTDALKTHYYTEDDVHREIQAYCDKFPTIMDASIALKFPYSHLCMILAKQSLVGIELPSRFGFKKVTHFIRTDEDVDAAYAMLRVGESITTTRKRRAHGPRKT